MDSWASLETRPWSWREWISMSTREMFDFRTAVGIIQWKSIWGHLGSLSEVRRLPNPSSHSSMSVNCSILNYESSVEGEKKQYLLPPTAEHVCPPFTLLCLGLMSCPTGSNRAALPGWAQESPPSVLAVLCWSGAPNFVVLTPTGLTPDFLQSHPPSSPPEGMIAVTAEVDGRGGLYLPSAPQLPQIVCL